MSDEKSDIYADVTRFLQKKPPYDGNLRGFRR